VSYESYKSVEGLGPGDLRALLSRGDAVERVWAAWALALDEGTAAVADLLDCLQNPDTPAGTRRHLIVVLAGFGCLSILERFAAEDPDERVRATSVQYLLRVSAGRLNATILDRILKDQSAFVRAAVLQEMETSSKKGKSGLRGLLKDPDPEVRRIAVERFK